MALPLEIEHLDVLKATQYRITESEFHGHDDEQDFVELVSDGECDSDGEKEALEAESDSEHPEGVPTSENQGKRKRTKDRSRIWAKKMKMQELQENTLSAEELLQMAKGGKGSLAKRTITLREDISTPVIHHGSGYIGKRASVLDGYPNTVAELLEHGYRLIKTGQCAVAGVDGEDRVVVVRVKRPKNVHTIILESINPLLDQIAECTGDAATVAGHNRGDFSRVQCGYHHGIGSKEPHPLVVNRVTVRAKVRALLRSKGMRSLMKHVRASLMTWFPTVAVHLACKHDEIRKMMPTQSKYPHLVGSPFTTTTFNLGPKTVTQPHKDSGNLLYGLCVIFVAGDHQADRGGHLVLKEPRMVMELEAGDMVILPSALVTHWNTELTGDTVRRSIVFWTCGNSVRYYAMGKRLLKNLSVEERKEEELKAKEEWRVGLQRFHTLHELLKM